MAKLSHIAVVDFEATCCGNNEFSRLESEIIQIGAVLVSLKKQEDQIYFTSYIKPITHPILTEYCINLTGITDEHLKDAKSFTDVIEEFRIFLDGNPWGSWGEFDYLILKRQCQFYNIDFSSFENHYNLKELYSKTNNLKTQLGLAKALKRNNLEFIGKQHNAILDAINTADLLPFIDLDKE